MVLGNLSVAEVEAIIEPDGVENDVGREPVALASIHPPILAISSSSQGR
jgi:hypothetical protein